MRRIFRDVFGLLLDRIWADLISYRLELIDRLSAGAQRFPVWGEARNPRMLGRPMALVMVLQFLEKLLPWLQASKLDLYIIAQL